MTLLSTLIDSRTIAGIAAAGSASYAHGLPSAPDFVLAYANASSAASQATTFGLVVLHNATNVTVSNIGGVASPVLKCIAVAAHSIIR